MRGLAPVVAALGLALAGLGCNTILGNSPHQTAEADGDGTGGGAGGGGHGVAGNGGGGSKIDGGTAGAGGHGGTSAGGSGGASAGTGGGAKGGATGTGGTNTGGTTGTGGTNTGGTTGTGGHQHRRHDRDRRHPHRRHDWYRRHEHRRRARDRRHQHRRRARDRRHATRRHAGDRRHEHRRRAGTGGTTPAARRGPAAPWQSQQGPCDIYGRPTPCAAAYSTIRALSKNYIGPLYQVRSGSSGMNTGSGGTTRDIGMTADGFADTAIQDSFCSGTVCTFSLLYDQSGNGNNLKVAPAGLGNGEPTRPCPTSSRARPRAR